ncbi:MAG: hypothetical protein IPQ09_12940 [Myxococcales bacterium]|nr:hypothetical protein [Myxococcales bacterium]
MIFGPTTKRASDVLLALFGLRLVLFALAALFVLPEVLQKPWRISTGHDEHFYYAHEQAALHTVSRFGELPAWNPFYCGGIVGIANPQDSTFAPEFILKLVFGVGPGRRMAYFLLALIGMEGMYRLARQLDASVIAAALAAMTFATNGFFTVVLRWGWLNFWSFQLMPWVLLCLLRGLRSRSWSVLGGVFIAWMVFQGGLYTVPYTLLVLGAACVPLTVWATLDPSATRRGVRRLAPLESIAIMGVVSVALSMAKLLPMIGVVVGSPRIWELEESLGLPDILSRLVNMGGFDGVSAFVGVGMLALACAAGVLERRGFVLALFAILFVATAVGDFAPWAPNSLLRKLPIFEQLRAPHRMVVVVSMFVCLGGARGLTWVEEKAMWTFQRVVAIFATSKYVAEFRRTKLIGAILSAVVAVVTGVIVFVTYQAPAVLKGAYEMEPPRPRVAAFAQSRGNRWDAQVFADVSLGSLQCFEETAFPQSKALRGDLPAEELAQDPTSASVTRESWSPNQIVLKVSASREATVVVNQNWHRAFQSNVGSVFSSDGLLAVKVPAGEHRLVIRFRDDRVLIGIAISCLTALALLSLGVRELRRFIAEVRRSIVDEPRAPAVGKEGRGPVETAAGATEPAQAEAKSDEKE